MSASTFGRLGILLAVTWLALSLYATLAQAYCNNCGGNMGCCPCPGPQAQCLYPYATCEEACGLVKKSGGGASVPGMAVPKMPQSSNPAVNMMNQAGQQMLYQGIQNLFNQPARSPEQIEADRQAELARQQELERQAEERRAQEQAAHDKLKSELKFSGGSPPSDDLGLKRSAPTDAIADADIDESIDPGDTVIKRHVDPDKKDMPKVRSNAFSKGFEHATGCFSQNSGAACGAVTAAETDKCLADYRAGYHVGDKKRVRIMNEARHAGERAKAAGELNNGASDARADGPCRTPWINAYTEGFNDGASRPRQ